MLRAGQFFRQAVEEAKELLDRREDREPATQHDPLDFLRCAVTQVPINGTSLHIMTCIGCHCWLLLHGPAAHLNSLRHLGCSGFRI